MTAAGPSLYRLADAEVLIGVAQTPGGPQPLFTDVAGESTVVAFTDVDEARRELPDSHQLFSISVAELAAQLPPHAGIVVDPRSTSPTYVPATSKQAVVEAALPFPGGAEVRIGEPAEEPVELLAEVSRAAVGWGLRRTWRTWYQAADARPRLLIVIEADAPATEHDAADAVIEIALRADYSSPLLVMALRALPPEHRAWLLANTAPFFEGQ